MKQEIKRAFFLGIVFFMSLQVAYTQTYHFRNYSKQDGIYETYTLSIYQDAKGFLWFGTSGGLSRFDGITFINFTKKDGLQDDFIRAITGDSKGNLWLATRRGGAICFTSGKFRSYTTAEGLVNNSVRSIFEDRNGTLWFGTLEGLSRFDGKEFKNTTSLDGLPLDSIDDIAGDTEGEVWLGTSSGLVCYDSDGFRRCTSTGSPEDKINAIEVDSQGRIWAGSDNGLHCLQNGVFSTYTTRDGLPHNKVHSVIEDRNGAIRIGTVDGFSIFSGKKFTNYFTRHGLPGTAIFSLLEDREGNTWLGTNVGISCLSTLKVANFSTRDGLKHNFVWAILQDRQSRYWFGTEEGLSCYSRGEFKNYTVDNGLPNNTVYNLLEDRQGKLWIATYAGLSVYENGTFTNYTKKNGLVDNNVISLYESPDGTIWVGTEKGLNRLKNGKLSTPPFKIKHIINETLVDKKGNMWFATDTGLYQYKRATRTLTKAADPGDEYIFTILETASGDIMIGHEGGLAIYKNGTSQHYTTRDGLPDDNCKFFLEENKHAIWIGTSNGLARFNGKSFKSYTTKKDGMSSDNWGPRACLKDSDGNVWFGSENGVTRFNPSLDRIIRTPPPIYITNLKILEKNAPVSQSHKLKHTQNYIRFGYAGLSFAAPRCVSYEYRLEGIEKEWIKTSENSIFYPYLPPGKYRFQVKAFNGDGIESLKPAAIEFEIAPPFWKTWWFLTFISVIFISLGGAAVFWKIRRTKEKAALEASTRQLVMSQRMELMGMLAAGAVHDLKNLLAIIIGYSEIVVEKFEPGDDSYRQIENIKNTSTTAVQIVKQILAFSRQKFDKNDSSCLPDLVDNILEIQQILHPPSISILWERPPEDICYPINPMRFQQLVMNLCLNGVQAMPEGGVLKISLEKDRENRVILQVTDTGSGIPDEHLDKIFSPLYTTKDEDKGTGLGLFVVKQVADMYNGRIDVNTTPGKGTTIQITLQP
ncbi:MAG: hypothetical protein GY757_46185 [bacterium]|nr:hypothetical protein [bacterium]